MPTTAPLSPTRPAATNESNPPPEPTSTTRSPWKTDARRTGWRRRQTTRPRHPAMTPQRYRHSRGAWRDSGRYESGARRADRAPPRDTCSVLLSVARRRRRPTLPSISSHAFLLWITRRLCQQIITRSACTGPRVSRTSLHDRKAGDAPFGHPVFQPADLEAFFSQQRDRLEGEDANRCHGNRQ